VNDSAVDPLRRIQQAFGDSLYGAAQLLVNGGSVLEVRVLQSGTVVTGIVGAQATGGPGATKYRVYIRDRARMEGECSCGERALCVHVAAVSIAAAQSARGPVLAAESRPRHVGAARLTPIGVGSNVHVASAESAQRQRLYFVFEKAESPETAGGNLSLEFRVSVWVAQSTGAARNESVVAGSACLFAPRFAQGRSATGAGAEFPRYVDPQDREILAKLTTGQVDGPWVLRGEAGADVLLRAVATGRAFWQSLQGRRLQAAMPREVGFAWELLSSGEQRLGCDGPQTFEVVLGVDPPLYIDAALGESGSVGLPCPVELLRKYAQHGPVAPERVPEWNERIAIDVVSAVAGAGAARFPRLRELVAQGQKLTGLTPRLVLTRDEQAIVQFLYNGLPVDSRGLRPDQQTVRRMSGDVLFEIPRDPDRERQLQSQLDTWLPPVAAGRESWLTFMLSAVPALGAAGWEVVVDERFPYRVVAPDTWYGDLGSDRQPGWFNLRLGVMVDGQPVNLLPALTRYLQSAAQDGTRSDDWTPPATDAGGCRIGEHWLVRLEDGRFLPVSLERIQRIAHTLVELFDRDSLNSEQALVLPRCQSARLAQLAGELNQPTFRSDDPSLRPLIEDLQSFTGIRAMAAPASFRGTLRPYQEEGLGWLQFLRQFRLGGVLADDMGLGKTVQTIAHIAVEIDSGRFRSPVLIVAPVSALGNWRKEIERFAPWMKVLTWHGAQRRRSHAILDQSHVVITAYPLLLLDSEVLLAREFALVILDEAQMIKNPRAKVSQMARALRAQSRLCLSGTPVENHLGELWSLFDFVQPGLLGGEQDFQRQYRTPIEKSADRRRSQALSARLAPFLLRRTKDAVARELPPKMEIVETVSLDEQQRDFYDGIRLAMHQRIQDVIREQGLARSQLTILDALLKLRQACCDPRLVAMEGAKEQVPSAKLEWLCTVLPELVAEGRRILLFSQFTSMLRLIEAAVTRLGIPYCLLTGETQDRTAVVERFQSGVVPLFLISLKAGGTALNLTAADTVIHYDPWWNPAVEAQATDRAHRIGQTRPVFVYKLIAQDTVEERMLQLQADKRVLASSLYTDKSASPTSLGTADLELLFAP
jgi:superfamily II DNA or RNA helicase